MSSNGFPHHPVYSSGGNVVPLALKVLAFLTSQLPRVTVDKVSKTSSRS